jgi:hypothetical protein
LLPLAAIEAAKKRWKTTSTCIGMIEMKSEPATIRLWLVP